MGTRVPRNTQAPLYRSGSCSTAEQEDQSIMPRKIARIGIFGTPNYLLCRGEQDLSGGLATMSYLTYTTCYDRR